MFPPRHMQTDVSKIALFSPHSLFSSSSLSHTYLSLVSHISNIISGAVMIDVFDFDRVMIRSSCTLSLIDPCCFRSESFFFFFPFSPRIGQVLSKGMTPVMSLSSSRGESGKNRSSLLFLHFFSNRQEPGHYKVLKITQVCHLVKCRPGNQRLRSPRGFRMYNHMKHVAPGFLLNCHPFGLKRVFLARYKNNSIRFGL